MLTNPHSESSSESASIQKTSCKQQLKNAETFTRLGKERPKKLLKKVVSVTDRGEKRAPMVKRQQY